MAGHGYLDLWPLTTKIESVNPWVTVDVCTKLEEITSMRFWDIAFAKTDGQQMQHFLLALLSLTCLI